MTQAFLNGAAALLLFLSGCAPASLPPAQSQHAASDLIQEQSVPLSVWGRLLRKRIYSIPLRSGGIWLWRTPTQCNVELVLYGENVLGEGENMVRAAQRGTLCHCSFQHFRMYLHYSGGCYSGYPCLLYSVYPAISEYMTGKFFDALNHAYREQGLELLSLRTGVQAPDHLEHSTHYRVRAVREDCWLRTSGSFSITINSTTLPGVQRMQNVGLSGLEYILEGKWN